MTEKERFQRAFAPLHSSPDTLTEVMKMTTKHGMLRRCVTLGLAAALVLALGGVAYAEDFGGIQRTVQLWIHGDQTDAVMTIHPGEYTIHFTGQDGSEHQIGGGGVAFNQDGTERPLTEDELLEHINAPEVSYQDDGTVLIYYYGETLDITDKFDDDGVCYVQLGNGKETVYMTIKYRNGYAMSPSKYISPKTFSTSPRQENLC